MPEVRDLAYQLEHGTYLGTCDWGWCNNVQVGWARAWGDDEWLSICDPCRKRGTSKDGPGLHPVEEFVSFAQAWRQTFGQPFSKAVASSHFQGRDDDGR